MENMLNVVRSSLSEPVIEPRAASARGAGVATTYQPTNPATIQQQIYGEWEYDPNEQVFDDTGEGAGVEGDLDVDDD